MAVDSTNVEVVKRLFERCAEMSIYTVPPLERRERLAFLPHHNFNRHRLEENLLERLPAGLSALGVQSIVGPEGFGKGLLRRVKYVIMLDQKPSSGQVCKYPGGLKGV
eukprot:3038812-Pyramimonas_sp.AAC.1